MTSKENGVELTCGTALQTGGWYSCGADAFSARGGGAAGGAEAFSARGGGAAAAARAAAALGA